RRTSITIGAFDGVGKNPGVAAVQRFGTTFPDPKSKRVIHIWNRAERKTDNEILYITWIYEGNLKNCDIDDIERLALRLILRPCSLEKAKCGSSPARRLSPALSLGPIAAK